MAMEKKGVGMRAPNANGFTLIELMVTIAVLAILVTLAVPSFADFRQRTVLRGAAEQVVSFWGDARFEALRRDSRVKVGFNSNAGQLCLGAATTTDPADDTPCDCFTAGACNVAAYPPLQADWRGVRVASASTVGAGSGVAVIDPKRGNLTQPGDVGRILLQAPNGPQDYRLDVVIDRNGRAVICEPSAAPAKLSDYQERRC
jgi:prepilin-type N-terminal cleavage/methylation domain-containing protein